MRPGSRTLEYPPSRYCKEELPTWDEVYNDFYLTLSISGEFEYLEDTHIDIDPYWNIPRRKLLLGMMCNQLNKMLFEDGKMEEAVKSIVIDDSDDPFQIQFQVIPMGKLETLSFKDPPVIYNWRLPSTGEVSIFTGTHPRFNIEDFEGDIILAMLTIGDRETIDNNIVDVVSLILREVIEYFTNGTGWKDEDGNLLPSDPMSHGCQGAGYDPALG